MPEGQVPTPDEMESWAAARPGKPGVFRRLFPRRSIEVGPGVGESATKAPATQAVLPADQHVTAVDPVPYRLKSPRHIEFAPGVLEHEPTEAEGPRGASGTLGGAIDRSPSLYQLEEQAVSGHEEVPDRGPAGARGSLTIEVFGICPAPHGAASERERLWRTLLVTRTHEALAVLRPRVLPDRSAWFAIEIDFFLPTMLIDLDNLAKPVLDTLFAAPPHPNAHLEFSGAAFEADDSQVVELALRKELADDVIAQGARIVVRWFDAH